MKSKTRLAFTGALILAVGFCLTACMGSDKSYESFSLLMDKTVGADRWSAQSNEVKSGTLIVKGLKVKAPAIAAELAQKEPAQEGAAAAAPAEPPALTVDSLEIKKLLDKPAMEKLLATADWKNAKETKLAEMVVLRGLTIPSPQPLKFNYELKIGETSLAAPTLKASGADAPAGPAGFLKALALNSIAFKDYNFTIKNDGIQVNAKMAQNSMDGIKFDGTPLKGLETLDKTGLIAVATAISAQKSSLSGLSINLVAAGRSGKGEGHMSLSLDSAEYKDIKGLFKVGEYALGGFKFEVITPMPQKNPETNSPITSKILFSLDKTVVKGIDSTDYMQRLVPIIAAACNNPAKANELWAQFQTMGDFFVSPVSLESASINGLELNVFDFVNFKIAEAQLSGPYVSGQIPAKQKSSVKGLELNFSDDANKYQGKGKEFYDTLQAFGMNSFKMEAEGEGAYEAATGLFSSRTNRFLIQDLMEMSGNLDIGGLTAERVETLKNTPLSMIYMALMAPDAIFGDMGINSLKLKLEDKSLVERTFKAVAASMTAKGQKTNAEQLRVQVVSGLQLLLTLSGSDYMEKPEELAKVLGNFLQNPQSLEIGLTPDPPFGLKSVMNMNGDYNLILNSLNLTVASNGDKPIALKFNIAGAGQTPDFDDDDDE